MQISVAKYVPRNTIIHKMDPRLKIAFNILFAVLFFVTTHLATISILLLLSLVFFYITTKRVKQIFTLMKMPIIIFIIMLIIYGFIIDQQNINVILGISSDNEVPKYKVLGLNPDETNHFISWYLVKPTVLFGSIKFSIGTVSIIRSLVLAIRIYGMIISTTILTYSTKPFLLTRAIEDLILPLKLLFIPTHIIAMIISIAIRFIPTLLLEATRIMKAQSSRGVDFKHGKIKDKVKSLITLVIPLFVLAFSRAEDLSNAMDVRGYDVYAKRSRYRRLVFNKLDYLFALIFIGLITLTVLMEMNIIPISRLPLWWLYTNQKI
ncbi:energy-coupling factor transporter transmembrane component T [Mesomycoplasma ovipneumoniae]|uniref:Energy-coupling factor transporter transmembrane component T n=1 Tax=Mesomycoplasma ovipneumoniae TaxID=29562 RepID=A0AAJ2UBR2_9BACT|nr:energy-coupling factor transporter transmembrane component T [Mesomycoplasma ovipneumoniae]MDW2829752.1 energy-coupling factor transporter transmembrane component T [Mesomycoplasma ovipneumoniae]MDW2834911.1 energy-coupling factor transporter transmembrane component T [Mesomycoplasma ovipneumoniae]MDW2861516.1 energy-coupling factor transporter transmembrane component T [Mesomycoplasma ovipneumoniae]MDW2871064.1 energy-coupling factor transporter transmembrane component T [Mesomycoplasma ovi